MFKKRALLITAVSAAMLGVVGCNAPGVMKVKGGLKDSSVPSTTMGPSAKGVMNIADLEVAPNKVIGQAKDAVYGDVIRDASLEHKALLNALRAGAVDQNGISADVLVGAQFHYHRLGNELTVTVVGYPARYKNFRAMPEAKPGKEELFTIQKVGDMTIFSYDKAKTNLEIDASGNMVVTAKETEKTPAPVIAPPPVIPAPAAAPAPLYYQPPADAQPQHHPQLQQQQYQHAPAAPVEPATPATHIGGQ